MSETYTVVLLVERALSAADAAQIRSLHEGLADEVRYHVLVPAEDAAARVEAAIGTLGNDTSSGARSIPPEPETIQMVREESERETSRALRATLEALHSAGARAQGEVVDRDLVEALAATVQAVDGREAIILTRPHPVSELVHRDWLSRARRAIGVPVLHLLEHESLDEQVSTGEGRHGLVSAAGFDGRARGASGSTPTPSAVSYRVTVAAGSLRLAPAGTGGVILDVPVSRVRTRPLGRAGSVVVDVDESPLLLNFSEVRASGDSVGATTTARRLVDAARGRRRRSRFLKALDGGRS